VNDESTGDRLIVRVYELEIPIAIKIARKIFRRVDVPAETDLWGLSAARKCD
jgi:hypothetical protein